MSPAAWRDLVATILLALLPAQAASSGLRSPAELLTKVGFDQRPGAAMPLDVPLIDDQGAPTSLGRMLRGKPAVLAFVYYRCPMLCTLTLNGLVRALRVIALAPGRDFSVIALSIDPWETPGLAREKKRAYLDAYQRPQSADGWHFLVARRPAIDALAGAAGFNYVYDAPSKQYAHAPGLIVLTPQGRVSQYLPGIEFDAKALRLALVQASAGRLGTIVDRAILLCYQYDPATGRYSLAILQTLRLLGALTILVIAGGVAWLLRADGKAA